MESIVYETQPLLRGMVVGTIMLLCYRYGLALSILQLYLNFMYRITNEKGKPLRGPEFSWPDGQTVEKFLQGGQKSFSWQAYGPLYRIWTVFRPEVVITRPEDVKAFFFDSHTHQKAASSNAGWLFSQILGDCLGLINGERWSRVRHAFDPFFTRKISAQRLPHIMAAGEGYVNEVHQYDLGGKQAASTINLNAVDAFQRFPFFYVAEIIYGPLGITERVELWKLAETHTNIFRRLVQGGIHRYKATKFLSTSAYKETAHFVAAWRQFTLELAQKQLREGRTSPLTDLMAEVEDGKVTLNEVLHTIDESLFANLDVTTHVLTWAIVLLGNHPDVQELVRSEIKANTNDLETYMNRKDTLLHYSLLESLRVRPLLAFTIPESAQEDKVLSGYRVPKNTDVVVDVNALHLRNPFWGADRMQYRPQRFQVLSKAEIRYNLSTFGFGPRKCLGQHMAENMIKAILVPLLRQFRFKLLADQYKNGEYKVDKTNWVTLSDVNLEMERIPSGGS